ncbi:fungal hydrophobin-domain-containing protein [Crucibulum laeve]|uniref:Hydrophobin n=1 Tax=Crucibulum laeve TaxID=68775 RepID=A0A5C3MBP3_9AGAR|nr:fungal hydrophobin-domain-containing protein [Crucibulum laeve]
MFSRILTAGLLALPLLSAASPVAAPGKPVDPSYVCNSGSVNCCNQYQQTSPDLQSTLNGLLGAIVGLGAGVGLNCDPISILGLGTNSCNQQTVCCSGNTFGGGLINLDCTPINIVL